MSRPFNDRFLGWAFAVALLLHALALAAAARIPSGAAVDGDLEQIEVFDRQAPIVASPVDLVDLSRESAREEPTAAALPPPPRSESKPAASALNRPRPAPALVQVARLATARPAASPARLPRPTPGGGGGGGWVDLGSRSSRGELPAGPDGGTPAGGTPGTGAGSGAGTGEGSGSGRGGGEGSGVGAGTGAGAGLAPESDKGTEAPAARPFVSRVADRAEPVVASKGALRYPVAAQEEGAEGTVKLKVLVSEAGSVVEVQIASSSGDRRLDAAAKEWVQGWRYRPAVQDGQPRRVYTNAVVEFELK